MSDQASQPQHFNQKQRRKAEFIKPPNMLKQKVGSGGLSDTILDKAQKLLEENAQEFQPLGEIYLGHLKAAVHAAKNAKPEDDPEALIVAMIYPAMQLKSNGGMFRYPLITIVGDKLVQFLEVLIEPDADSLEIVMAFHSTMRIILTGHIKGDGGQQGKELIAALDEACMRYFKRYPYNRGEREGAGDFFEVDL